MIKGDFKKMFRENSIRKESPCIIFQFNNVIFNTYTSFCLLLRFSKMFQNYQ